MNSSTFHNRFNIWCLAVGNVLALLLNVLFVKSAQVGYLTCGFAELFVLTLSVVILKLQKKDAFSWQYPAITLLSAAVFADVIFLIGYFCEFEFHSTAYNAVSGIVALLVAAWACFWLGKIYGEGEIEVFGKWTLLSWVLALLPIVVGFCEIAYIVSQSPF